MKRWKNAGLAALLVFALVIGGSRPGAAAGRLGATAVAAAGSEGAAVKAKDIAAYLKSLGPWVDWNHTCDTFKAGDPEREVKTLAVSWMSTLDALEKAHAMGCEMFITHEPTFYSHMDDDPTFDKDTATTAKRQLLTDSGMVVYRCHDVWDRVPGEGILASWAAALGLSGKPAAERTHYAVFNIPAMTVEDLARDMALRLQRFGQEAVQVTGDLKAKVRRLAIGTGAIADPREMHAMGADAAVVTEIIYWRDVSWARDMGFPLFIVAHSVSECPGMESLAAHLRWKFPAVRVVYVQEGCPFRLVGPAGPLTK
jgi:putative NIF3 family GTP cyclohydrolase 1 type 2